ncbi:MAG TPA: DUF4252 domain-containing protein [Blastocatellia bacterium]|nr:DUF4252 domain-containing protein [Blastocatellia bacterium]HMX29474.1 DUF4252 domain-containing protein [Blastocatellia bacterium]HMY74117.1 DUF4252 domain-containing protein [Blastocatellia bacterium]HMZ17229.1 DUF4252 domain-containing protein [Blastocatellia bacterium]HNG29640.1 DUF4252 domain-containing protein [Blastocatellia bacterium]
MKSNMPKLILAAALLTLTVAANAFAQNARLQINHLDSLFPKAAETIDVSIDGTLLQIASKFLDKNRTNEAAVREILGVLKGVYVKGVEFDKEGEFSEQDVQQVRQQLAAPGWERIVGVRSKHEGENVEVYLMLNNGLIEGIGVLITDPKQLMVVNVVGPIDPEKITELRGSFGIPSDFNLDWGGAGVRRTQKGRTQTERRDSNN